MPKCKEFEKKIATAALKFNKLAIVNKYFFDLNYNATLNYLYTKLPMFQRTGPAAYKNNLDNALRLDELFRHPHRAYKTIHVAGTNGKGSVSHMLSAILQNAGYKTGLYTSPHLKDFRERIRINGQLIAKEEVCEWIDNFRINNELWKIQPSFFELTGAMAFDIFAREKVDVAVIETGLGGRLDSTNIITPELSIITNIGLDHTNLLGDTLEKIAHEKAGIIKKHIPAIIGTTQTETEAVFREKAAYIHSPLYFADQEYKVSYAMRGINGKNILSIEKNGKLALQNIEMDLCGNYQHKNIPAVLKAVDMLNEKGWGISEVHLRAGLANVVKLTGLLGRWQVIGNNPLTICDTGHNADGIKEVVEQINNTPHNKLHIVLGTVSDKNPDNVLDLLPREAQYYFVKANIARALDEKELKERAAAFGLKGESYSSVRDAVVEARESAEENDLVFVGGSNFVVAEIL